MTNMTHVPYKGGGPAMAGVMAGQVDMLFAPLGSVLPHVRAGKLRALAVASKERAAKLLDTATMIQSGFANFVVADSWGFLGPAALPPGPARRLHQSIATVLKQPELAKRLDDQGVGVSSSTPEELRDYIRTEVAKYRDVIVSADIRVE